MGLIYRTKRFRIIPDIGELRWARTYLRRRRKDGKLFMLPGKARTGEIQRVTQNFCVEGIFYSLTDSII